ncbi:pyridoxal-phosphate dependent enzyme [Streptacidiphilus sp. 4-A2]|nr:pyridoxal-phosphate dependent enzyme [Streptacidiphilus sp. 4-A2]
MLPGSDVPRSAGPGRLPTPLEQRHELGDELGVRLLLKREDLIDDLGCGHKVRKLGYVAAAAVAQGATALVTGGSLPSSQCVAVAAAAERLGLRSHLVYSGDEQVKPDRPLGSYLLALLFDSTVSWHERTSWTRMDELLEAAAEAERERGERPYVVPPGISTWPGLLGSVDLGLELAEQLAALPEGASDIHVVAAAGSGSTCLGLSLAARLLGLRWKVHGMCIGGTAEGIEARIAELREEAVELLGAPALRESPVQVHGESLGAGYDRPSPEDLETMRRAVVRHGLLLDPNYMVKTFRGLRSLIGSGAVREGDRVVLVHTGGSLGLFGDAPALRGWYQDRMGAHLAAPAAADTPAPNTPAPNTPAPNTGQAPRTPPGRPGPEDRPVAQNRQERLS